MNTAKISLLLLGIAFSTFNTTHCNAKNLLASKIDAAIDETINYTLEENFNIEQQKLLCIRAEGLMKIYRCMMLNGENTSDMLTCASQVCQKLTDQSLEKGIQKETCDKATEVIQNDLNNIKDDIKTIKRMERFMLQEHGII
jgi:hypothetical protein